LLHPAELLRNRADAHAAGTILAYAFWVVSRYVGMPQAVYLGVKARGGSGNDR